MLNVNEVQFNEKYLGLPIENKRGKRSIIQVISERCLKNLSRWKEKLPSKIGKETLKKSIF